MRQLWSFEFQKIVGRKLIRVALLAYGVLILILLSNSRVDFLDIFDQNGRHLHGKEALEYELKMAERYRGPVTEEKVDALLVQEKQGAKNAGMNGGIPASDRLDHRNCRYNLGGSASVKS